MGDIPSDWTASFRMITGQGKACTALSPRGDYVAFLSKTDFNTDTQRWDLFFEVLAGEFVCHAYAGSPKVMAAAPSLPALGFHVRSGVESVVLSTLGLKNTDFLAEGSWYVVHLTQGGDPETQIVGDLYDPDIDIDPKRPDHGNHGIEFATLLFLPGMRRGWVVPTPPDPLPVPDKRASDLYRAVLGIFTKATAARYAPHAPRRAFKRPRSPKKLGVPPPIAAVGVMDVGQGNCNLLLDNAFEPLVYYDVGYPLWFYLWTLPDAMHSGQPGYQGPITNNAARNLGVILSHWDWDHWRQGRIEPRLANLPWMVPQQPVGPVTQLFVNLLIGLGNLTAILGGPLAFPGPNGSTVMRAVPPAGAVPAVVMNNSGLALLFQTDLPLGPPPYAGNVMLTGDASCGNLPPGMAVNVTGMTAVHHGSIAHGAAANLPAPPGMPGRIAYSYGMTAAGARAYNFPVPLAVALYQAGNWTVEQSTAEGAAIRGGVLAHGNIRLGDQTPLAPGYNYSAFFPITYALT